MQTTVAGDDSWRGLLRDLHEEPGVPSGFDSVFERLKFRVISESYVDQRFGKAESPSRTAVGRFLQDLDLAASDRDTSRTEEQECFEYIEAALDVANLGT